MRARLPRVAAWMPSLRVYALTVATAAAIFKLAAAPDPKLAYLLLGALAAGLVLPVLARHPTLTICLLLAIFPLQLPVLGWLYAHGLPLPLARQLGALKDLMGIALVIRAVQDRSSHRFRPSDPWAVGYLVVASAYLLLPYFVGSLAQLPVGQRLLAWRIDCFYVIVFLAIRRIDPDTLNLRIVRGTVIGLATLVAGIAVYEYYQPAAWEKLFYSTLGVRRYSTEVLGSKITADAFIRKGLNGTIRSKSLISDPVFCAFYLLPGLLLTLTRISSRRWFGATLLTLVIGAGVLATQTRAAVIVALLAMLLASVLILNSGRRVSRYLAPILVCFVLLMPIVAARTPVLQRVTQAAQGQDQSAKAHVNDFNVGLNRAIRDPLGAGLGTAAGVGQRFDITGTVVSEDAYLQVVNELGVVALLTFVGFLVALLREFRARGRETDDRFLDRTAALGLLLVMIVGGFLQQVWYDFSVSVVVAVVLALPLMTRSTEDIAFADQARRRQVLVG